MFVPSKNLYMFLNFVHTAATARSVVYETEPDPILTSNQKHFLKFSLPEGVEKDGVKQLLITVCKKATPRLEEYFKQLTPQTEHLILSPSFQNNSLKIDLENISLEPENDFLDVNILTSVQKEFNRQKEEKEKAASGKISAAVKHEVLHMYSPPQTDKFYCFDYSFEIFSEFEKKYKKGNLKDLAVLKDDDTLYKENIDMLFTKEMMKQDVSKCAKLCFESDAIYGSEPLKYTTRNNENITVAFKKWTKVFVNKLLKSLTDNHFVEIKKYLKDTNSQKTVTKSLEKSIVEKFKTALETHYKTDFNSLNITGSSFTVGKMGDRIKHILKILDIKYSYLERLLKKLNRIAISSKRSADAISGYNGNSINIFTKLLIAYKNSFEHKDEEIISSFIEGLNNKLNEAVTENITTKKAQFNLFNVLKDNQKVLQFTLIFNESKYIYPGFYTFMGNALVPLEDNAEVEVYKIINGQGTEGIQGPSGTKGPKGDTGPQGKDGAAGVSETIPVQKTNFFLSKSYQIFLLLYLILLSSIVFYLILRNLNQREFK